MKELFKLRGIPVVELSEMRVSHSDRDKNLYYYEIRGSDDEFDPCEVCTGVLINFFGTLATTAPLPKEMLPKIHEWTEEAQFTDDEVDLIYTHI